MTLSTSRKRVLIKSIEESRDPFTCRGTPRRVTVMLLRGRSLSTKRLHPVRRSQPETLADSVRKGLDSRRAHEEAKRSIHLGQDPNG